jgi:glutamate-1-semialdehyde 2,1-aminomutase
MNEVVLQSNDLDRRIWEEELEEFVPRRVFDAHTHIYRWDFNTDPAKDASASAALFGRQFGQADWAALEACDRVLLPGREVHRLSFPYPFTPSCEFEASNRFVLEETSRDPVSGALMLVHPSMTEPYLDQHVRGGGFVGFKPYRFYSTTGDTVQCRITDFLPEHQIRVADRHGLIVTMHLARRDAVADPQNLDDLVRLTDAYPNVKWILAHCARSYSDWVVHRAASTLRKLKNAWYDTSSVCDSDAILALIEAVGIDRVMYGSDDLPVGALRGKYISFGYGWAYLSETNHSIDLSHCDPRMTFTRYEQLRAMRRATRRLGLTPEQIDGLFSTTAERLVKSVRHK